MKLPRRFGEFWASFASAKRGQNQGIYTQMQNYKNSHLVHMSTSPIISRCEIGNSSLRYFTKIRTDIIKIHRSLTFTHMIASNKNYKHQKAVLTLNKGKSFLAEHVCDTKHMIAWENSKIITIVEVLYMSLHGFHLGLIISTVLG